MPILREKIVAEDIEVGTGTVTRTSDSGGTMTGTKVNIGLFYPITDLEMQEVSQALPLGLWRLHLGSNTFRIDRNTASAGDFSTVSTPLSISTSTITLSDAYTVRMGTFGGSNTTATGLMGLEFNTADTNSAIGHTCFSASVNLSPASDNNILAAGVQGFARAWTPHTYANNFVGVTGIAYTMPQAGGAVNVSYRMIGTYGRCEALAPSGTIAVAYSILAEGPEIVDTPGLGVVGASTITDSIGVGINGPDAKNNGTITRATGLWISDVANATENWAIRAEGGQTYHVGNMTLGSTTAPTVNLDIYGTDNANAVIVRRTGGNAISITGISSAGHGYFSVNNSSATVKALINANGNTYFIGGNVLVGNNTHDVTVGSAPFVLTIGDTGGFVAAGATANASVMSITVVNSNYVSLNSGKTGSGTYLPIAFFTSGTRIANFSTAGNLELLTGVMDTKTGGSTSISSGTGTVKMTSVNNANNAAWIPLKYNGTTYYVPAWTTHAP